MLKLFFRKENSVFPHSSFPHSSSKELRNLLFFVMIRNILQEYDLLQYNKHIYIIKM